MDARDQIDRYLEEAVVGRRPTAPLKPNPRQIIEMLALLRGGKSTGEVADKMGLSHLALLNWLHANGHGKYITDPKFSHRMAG